MRSRGPEEPRCGKHRQPIVRLAYTALADHVDLWMFPVVVMIAWLYYPYCHKGPTLCIWKALTNRECPGCGLTRAFCFLVHGQLYRALEFNRISPFAFLLMGGTFVAAFRDYVAALNHSGTTARRLCGKHLPGGII